LLNKTETLINKRFELNKKKNKCKVFEGRGIKSVHFGSEKKAGGSRIAKTIPYSPFPRQDFFSKP
jgi:hypothetical protein